MIGGNTRGGIYGSHPSLDDLDNGNLKYGTDFRSIYATVIERWLGRSPGTIVAGNFPAIGALA